MTTNTNETVEHTVTSTADQGATPATPDTAGATVTDTADQVEATQIAPAEQPASEPLQADDGATAEPAGETAEPDQVEGATPAQPVEGNPEPVKPAVTLVPPTKAAGESNKAFKKRLAAWHTAHPDYVQPANRKGGNVEPVKAADQPKPQGGKPTSNMSGAGNAKPVDKPAPTPAPVKVEPAVKPVKLTARQQALTDDARVCGYDLSLWPAQLLAIKPTRDAIEAVRALGVLKTWLTKNELAAAVYIGPNALMYNVYDVATALQAVCGGSHDHKMNVCNQKLVPAGMVKVAQARVPGVNGGKALVAYRIDLTGKGLKLVTAHFAAHKWPVPLWLTDLPAYQAEQVKAAERAVKQAEREAKRLANA